MRGSGLVEALLLGVAQDAGVPQAGCACPTCERARPVSSSSFSMRGL